MKNFCRRKWHWKEKLQFYEYGQCDVLIFFFWLMKWDKMCFICCKKEKFYSSFAWVWCVCVCVCCFLLCVWERARFAWVRSFVPTLHEFGVCEKESVYCTIVFSYAIRVFLWLSCSFGCDTESKTKSLIENNSSNCSKLMYFLFRNFSSNIFHSNSSNVCLLSILWVISYLFN